MKAKPYRNNRDGEGLIECEPSEATHIMLRMLGPLPDRLIPVIQNGSRRDHPGPVWTWNGDVEKPTLKPSIRTRGQRQLTDDEHRRLMAGDTLNIPDSVCHTWITDGQSIFLADCTHELAGQTHNLLDL